MVSVVCTEMDSGGPKMLAISCTIMSSLLTTLLAVHISVSQLPSSVGQLNSVLCGSINGRGITDDTST